MVTAAGSARERERERESERETAVSGPKLEDPAPCGPDSKPEGPTSARQRTTPWPPANVAAMLWCVFASEGEREREGETEREREALCSASILSLGSLPKTTFGKRCGGDPSPCCLAAGSPLSSPRLVCSGPVEAPGRPEEPGQSQRPGNHFLVQQLQANQGQGTLAACQALCAACYAMLLTLSFNIMLLGYAFK